MNVATIILGVLELLFALAYLIFINKKFAFIFSLLFNTIVAVQFSLKGMYCYTVIIAINIVRNLIFSIMTLKGKKIQSWMAYPFMVSLLFPLVFIPHDYIIIFVLLSYVLGMFGQIYSKNKYAIVAIVASSLFLITGFAIHHMWFSLAAETFAIIGIYLLAHLEVTTKIKRRSTIR